MIRHISIYTLEKKEETEKMVQMLKKAGENCPLIVNSRVGVQIGKQPPKENGAPDFGDVVQEIDFRTREDADAYPESEEHRELMINGPKMRKVTAIDFEIDETLGSL